MTCLFSITAQTVYWDLVLTVSALILGVYLGQCRKLAIWTKLRTAFIKAKTVYSDLVLTVLTLITGVLIVAVDWDSVKISNMNKVDDQ